ncbi:MAG TPA: ribonuclease J [Deltaproteobacteria bacterium]|nr:ribonuclease J [Deltaproteobacteria bacterium]
MIKVIPLGGLGEIGLNMMAIQHEETILVVDVGLMFPDDYMPGVDLVIPDFGYLRSNRKSVKAVILTHGHEDHIGAMPFFLREFNVPVFGTGFTLGILREKLKEHQLLEKTDLRQIRQGDVTDLGPFKVEYISVNHSIVDGVGLAIHTPEGILIHSGDFRIDPTPVDSQHTDIIRFAHFGQEGVLALFSDSTNAEKEGFTLSEMEVRKTLEDLFRKCRGRIIVSSFASNITRIQQVISLASTFGRKVVFNGRSMITNVGIAEELGFIELPEDLEITEKQIRNYPDDQVAIITTGSQGEPMSALTRMALDQHKGIQIKEGDTVVFSSRFIPGNQKAITSVINKLYRMGADVIYEKISDIHTSGHARREELKFMLGLVKPRFFIPIHGEYRHLVKHAQVAMNMGMDRDNVLLAEDGNVIRFENNQMALETSVSAGRVLVDGKGVGDVGEMILRDRRKLSSHGMVLVLLGVDENTGETVYGPDIISRGFVFENQNRHILQDAECIILEVLDELERPQPMNYAAVESDIRRRLKRFFYNVIGRSPLIVPVIISL